MAEARKQALSAGARGMAGAAPAPKGKAKEVSEWVTAEVIFQMAMSVLTKRDSQIEKGVSRDVGDVHLLCRCFAKLLSCAIIHATIATLLNVQLSGSTRMGWIGRQDERKEQPSGCL